jgi:hypothetical protein
MRVCSVALLSLMIFVMAGESARAGTVLGAGGGVFVPWSGDAGFSVSTQVMGTVWKDHLRIGGEFEFRRFDTKIVGFSFDLFGNPRSFSKATYENYNIRFLISYYPIPDAVVSPYVGFGMGIAIYAVDNEAQTYRDEVSGGLGMLVSAGVEVPLGSSRVAWFAETRVGLNFDFWDDKLDDDGDNDQVDEVGGFTGMAGLRFKF